MYEQSFLQDLRDRVDLTEIMESYGIDVRRGSGKNDFFIASFCCGKDDYDNGRITKETQLYSCMACKKGGNIFNLVMTMEDVPFPAAVKKVAKWADVSLPGKDGKESKWLQRKYEAYEIAATFFEQYDHDYLNQRGVSHDVLRQSRAGYAPGGRALRNHSEQKGFTKQELLDFELINQRGMDSLFKRVVIPVIQQG